MEQETRQILELIHEACKKDKLKRIRFDKLVRQLDMPSDALSSHLDYLENEKMIVHKRSSHDFIVVRYYSITNKGINWLEGRFQFSQESSSTVVQGDYIAIRDMSNVQGVAIGRQSAAVFTQHASNVSNEVSDAFAGFFQALRENQDAPRKQVAVLAVEGLQREAQKGEKAEERIVEEWIEILQMITPDIGKMVIGVFVNQIGGLNTVFQEIARKVQSSQAS